MPMNRALEHAISAARRLADEEQTEIASMILDKIKAMHGAKAIEPYSSNLEDLPQELAKNEPKADIWDVNA